MLPEDTFNDRETQVIKVALQNLINIQKNRIDNGALIEPLNEFDILAPRHTLMHALTALEKLTKSPIRHYMNPNQPELPLKTLEDVATLQQQQ